jgi:hypothetical protein
VSLTGWVLIRNETRRVNNEQPEIKDEIHLLNRSCFRIELLRGGGREEDGPDSILKYYDHQ